MLLLGDHGDKGSRRNAEPFSERIGALCNELGNAARGRTVLVQSEPEHGPAFRLHLELFGELVDLLSGNARVPDGDRLDDFPLHRRKAAALHQVISQTVSGFLRSGLSVPYVSSASR